MVLTLAGAGAVRVQLGEALVVTSTVVPSAATMRRSFRQCGTSDLQSSVMPHRPSSAASE